MDDKAFKRFDMKKEPALCRWYLKPLLWLLCFPALSMHGTKIVKEGTGDLKGPYVLLGNHNAFYDMKVSIAATFPRVANYVVAIDGFIGREWLLRLLGCICKRKFTSDMILIRHLNSVVKKGGIIGLYPEARYSLCGTTAPLPESLGKLCKLLGVPVVTLICHGHHINHPFWNTRRERKVRPTQAKMKLLITADELKKLSVDEINDRIVKEFQYDDFRWQAENGVRVKDPERAVGLEKILYQCRLCGTEFKMRAKGSLLFCEKCGSRWEMSELGELVPAAAATAEPGSGELVQTSPVPEETGHGSAPKTDQDSGLKAAGGQKLHIPDWYEWERENVRRQVREGTYSSVLLPVTVESLPNAKRFIPPGSGTMLHDMNGFHVKVTDSDGAVHEMEKPVLSLYSCHVEYNYLFKHGDCVDLNTLDDTWYTYPDSDAFSVTKMALATEELYYLEREKAGRPCRSGLA